MAAPLHQTTKVVPQRTVGPSVVARPAAGLHRIWKVGMLPKLDAIPRVHGSAGLPSTLEVAPLGLVGLLASAIVSAFAVIKLRQQRPSKVILQPLDEMAAVPNWAMASLTESEANDVADEGNIVPLRGSEIRYEPEALQSVFKPAVKHTGLRPRNGKREDVKEAPNAEYDETIAQLKKKLLFLRMMRAVNHPDFRQSDMKKAKKMVARLMTAKRFEELRAQGIDPYAEYKIPRKERRKQNKAEWEKAEAERKRIISRAERIRQLQLKEDRRAQRRAERLAMEAENAGTVGDGVAASAGGLPDSLP